MSQWAMSPGKSLEAAPQNSSSLKPPRDKGLGKLLNLRFDFFRSKKKPSSPLKPKTTESDHQLKLMNNRLVQWRFVNARASAENNTPSKGNNVIIITSTHQTFFQKQLLCAWVALTKLQNLVIQERDNLQKKNLEMKLAHVFLSQKEEAVSDAIISTVNSFSPTIEDIVALASQLAEVVAQEKLMLEECHVLMRMISELEMEERSLKCCLIINRIRFWIQNLFKTRALVSITILY
ncbi:unnamed protein product [Eruca vesicaria subsp. sativa]|uniref:QWRF motif-containing protein 3 n=1 Tax=Eruca vesicaria subsp. sativa TaxID=29727 RepID=A0ABC8L5U8_ERUVS|nr:unnamed protein product [Eruca vesicaria subsp. sativa]